MTLVGKELKLFSPFLLNKWLIRRKITDHTWLKLIQKKMIVNNKPILWNYNETWTYVIFGLSFTKLTHFSIRQITNNLLHSKLLMLSLDTVLTICMLGSFLCFCCCQRAEVIYSKTGGGGLDQKARSRILSPSGRVFDPQFYYIWGLFKISLPKFFQEYYQSVKPSGSRSGQTKRWYWLRSKLFARTKTIANKKRVKLSYLSSADQCILEVSIANSVDPGQTTLHMRPLSLIGKKQEQTELFL